MGREILFRGKRIDNGEWVEGAYFPDKNGDALICTNIIAGTPIDESAMCITWSVDPATIGQSTGLTDKNGRKIFEGDLITTAWWHGHVSKVVFKNGMFKAEYNPLFSWVANETYEIAVVGNVWDNPELLEGE